MMMNTASTHPNFGHTSISPSRSRISLLVVALVASTGKNRAVSAAGFCNWGPAGTAASSTCDGGAQGGVWCNADQDQCESGCSGNWCSPTNGGQPSPAPTGFCNWGPAGTAASSTCEGGAQGGVWCNADQDQCESGCSGNWCTPANGGQPSPAPPTPTSPTNPAPAPAPTSTNGCSDGWTPASWTHYTSYAPCCEDSPNYDPNADTTECDEYSACDYTGDFAYIGHKSFNFVQNNNLISFFSTHGDNTSFGSKKIQISAGGKTIEALVADTCGDNDCDGCCTENAGPSGYLVDMEYHTVVKNFGSAGAATGPACWKLVAGVGGGNSDIGSGGGYCNWGDDGEGDSSECKGGPQGGGFCNANEDNCASECGGKWCV